METMFLLRAREHEKSRCDNPAMGEHLPGGWLPPQAPDASQSREPEPPAPPPTFVRGPAETGTNGLAIASLTAGFLWLGWLGSIAAVIFGHVALAQIKNSGGRETGQGLAIGGLVLGWLQIGVLLIVVLAAAF